jgi:ferrous iron transport protein B
MTDVVSKAEALAFMCACTFNIPCVMALSTTYRESHSLKWTARIAAFYVCGALVLSFIVYHIAALFV